jgi:DNA-binding response OmpR family regulator
VGNKKILLVEDDPDILRTVTVFLEREGFEILTSLNGIDGLHKARTEKPDLIILDIMLPGLDGYKICRMLKFDVNYKRIPIVVFTARAQKSDEALGKEVGADAYITKPFEPQALIEKIKGLLGNV